MNVTKRVLHNFWKIKFDEVTRNSIWILYMRSVWQITELVSQMIYFNSKQITWFPFQSNPLKSNALFHPSLLCFFALFWDIFELCCKGLCDGLHSFKISSLDGSLKLGEKKNVTWSKIQWIRRFFSFSSIPLSQERLYAQGVVSGWIVILKQLQFITLISSHLLSKAYATGSLCRLADWSSCLVARTWCRRNVTHIKECN